MKNLCNVDPWLTDNFYEENNLYNAVTTSPLKSVGGVPTWVAQVAWVAACLRGCLSQTFFWHESKIFGCGLKCFGVGQMFFGPLGQH